MPIPQEGSLPPFLVLASGMTVRITAVDPTTGALVSGVTVSGASIDVEPETAGSSANKVPEVDAAFTYQGSS